MAIARDRKVTTWASKIGVVDKASQSALTDGEPTYWVVCMSPASRWLLLSLLAFIEPYKNRWLNFADVREIDQLIAETNDGIICPMACQDDIQAINTTLQGISLTLIEMRDILGGPTADIDTRLTEIKTEIQDIDLTLVDFGLPDLIDKIEPITNGIGVILGAPDVPLNGGP